MLKPFFLIAVFILTACSAPPDVAIRAPIMGTSYTILISQDLPETTSEDQLSRELHMVIDTVNQSMSTYLVESEISRFNRHSSTEPFAISQVFATVIQAAMTVSEASQGAFDITAGPLIDLWGFGANYPDNTLDPTDLPDEKQIQITRARTGYDKLTLRQTDEQWYLIKQQPDLKIDVSAIAKGYATDLAAEYLLSLGLQQFMVEVGGEIRTHGLKRDGEPWRIAIEQPLLDERRPLKLLRLENAALATSGDYRNYVKIGDQHYSHTINPQTGYPIPYRTALVSVMHDDCMLADAWATALMAMPAEQAIQQAQQQSISALIVLREDDGTLTEFNTGDFGQFIEQHY